MEAYTKTKYVVMFLLFTLSVTGQTLTFTVTEDIEIQTDALPNYPVYVNSSDLELSGRDIDINPPAPYDQISYLRFANVSIPNGATITNAQLKFYLKNSPTQSNTLQIAVENSLLADPYPPSDVTDFATGNEIVNSRSYSSGVNWTTTAGSASSSVLTPNLVTDLPAGLSTGQLAQLTFRVTAINAPQFFNVHSQNTSNEFHPRLIIDYTLGAVVPEPVFFWSGALTDNSINVRAKLSTAADNCTLVVSTNENDWSSPVVSSAVDVTVAKNLMGSFTATGLAPSTNYFYRIKIGSTIATNLTGKFTTAPSPAATDKSFTFLAGACSQYSYSNIDDLGVNFKLFNEMKDDNSLFFLSTGDLHYGNPNQDLSTEPASISNNRKAYEYLLFGNLPATKYGSNYNDAQAEIDFFNSSPNDYNFNTQHENNYSRQEYTDNILSEAPKFKSFLLSIPIAYVWDDHDFSGDGSRGTGDWVARGNFAKQAYREYVPHYPFPANNTDDDKPIYQAYTIGNVRFILMDLRSEQTDNKMISEEQIYWFKKECLEAKKNNQLISWATSVGPTSTNKVDVNDYNSAEKYDIEDRWGHSSKRTQRNLIFQWLKDAQIQNLFIISGDAHSLGIDDGQNTDCDNSNTSNNCGRAENATSPHYPLFQTAPLIHDGPSHKFITTSLLDVHDFNTTTLEANRGHYTKFAIEDTGDGYIKVKTSMKRIEGENISQYQLEENIPYTTTNPNSNSYIEGGNTYVFKRNLIEANAFALTQDSSIVAGNSVALSGSCSGGTLSWYNNSTALVEASATVSPTATTTYTAKCDVGYNNIVELGQVTITVLSGPPCGYNQNLPISNSTQPAYTARGYITTNGNVVYPTGNKEYVAGKAITLTPPAAGGAWETSNGTVFQAKIDPNLALCNIQIATLFLTKPVGDANTHLGLTWSNPSVSFTGTYRVEYAPAGGSSWTTVTTVSNSTHSYNVTSVLPQFVLGEVYKFRVVVVTTPAEYPSAEKSITCVNTPAPNP